jgi:NAD(P)-dependent dehydrogenase (short-subunit alcohol dehydrogenase family)
VSAATTPNLFSVSGKRVLVIGGSSGIGSMIAGGFVAAGATVIIVGRDGPRLHQRAVDLQIDGGLCTALVGDVSTEDGCRAIAGDVGEAGEPLDVLVNSAGASAAGPLEEFDEQAWHDVLAVNLTSVPRLSGLLLPRLREAAERAGGPSRIINIGSIAGERVSDMDNYAYTSSKAALHHLTRHLARRLAPSVTVNAIAPGPFQSLMTADVLARHGDAIARTAPMQRIGQPDDIAAAALYLSSPAGAWVTGTVLTVDGGLSLT